MKKQPSVSVIIPTYNESGNILPLLSAIHTILKRYAHELIVVDDDSPDGTADLVLRHAKQHREIRCIVRKANHGLGLSILEGIRHASGDVIIGMDADFNHDPAVIGKLLTALNGCDIAVASRFVEGGGMSNAWRYAGSLMFNGALRLFLGYPIWDNTSGYYAIRRKQLLRFPLSSIYRGYGEYHIGLMWHAHRKGFVIREIPVYYGQRQYGQSKSALFTMALTYTRAAIRFYRSVS